MRNVAAEFDCSLSLHKYVLQTNILYRMRYFFSLSDNSTEDNIIENGTVNQGNDFDDDSCEDAREEAPPSNTKKVLREMNFSRIS